MLLNDFPEDELTVLRGTISEVEVVSSRHDLVDQIKTKNTPLSNAILHCKQHDIFSADTTTDYTHERFVALINDMPVYGEFDGAAELPLNQPIKAVVARYDDLLWIYAIVEPLQGRVWTKYYQGTNVHYQEHKNEFVYYLFSAVTFTAIILSSSGFNVENITKFLTMILPIILAFLYVARPRKHTSPDDAKATDTVLKLIGNEDPQNVNLLYYSETGFGIDYAAYNSSRKTEFYQNIKNSYDIYSCRRATQAGYASLYGVHPVIPEHQQRVIEGPIRDLVIDPHTASNHFSSDLATDLARVYATDNTSTSFIAFIDEEPVCGCFDGIEKINNGDYVKATVYEQQNITIVTGLLSESKNLIWTYHPIGEKTAFFQRLKKYCLIGGMWTGFIFLFSGMLYIGGDVNDDIFLASAICGIILSALIIFKNMRTPSFEQTWRATVVSHSMKLFGFKNAKTIKLPKKHQVIYEEIPKNTPYRDVYKNLYKYNELIGDGYLKKTN